MAGEYKKYIPLTINGMLFLSKFAGRVVEEGEGRLVFASLQEEWEEDLVEALGDVDGDVVNAVLHGAAF